MATTNLIKPDLQFISEISSDEGGNPKKCYQCATCSTACSISHDSRPFPRKEMLYASWGLKDKLTGNPDIWLCYNCGDCSTLCPRDAKPADVMNSLRKASINEYSKPAVMNRLLNSPKWLALLFIIPALLILGIGMITGMINFNPSGDKIVYARFFPVLLIELIFIPLTLLVVVVFFLGLKRFFKDVQTNYQHRGFSVNNKLNLLEFFKTMLKTMPSIIKHKDFSSCSENKTRKLSHMLVSFSFVSLAFVAAAFVLALYVLDSHGPYSQINPIKILANVSGLALVLGTILLMKERMANSLQKSGYFDWYLLIIALGLGVTGMLTQLIRLADYPIAAYTMYFIHLVFAFNLIAFLPYSKLAHLVYRTVAVTFHEYVKKQEN